MSDQIGSFARSILGFLGIQSQGVGPSRLSNDLVPTIDATSFFGVNRIAVWSANQTVAAGSETGFSPALPIPPGEAWGVIAIQSTLDIDPGDAGGDAYVRIENVPRGDGSVLISQIALKGASTQQTVNTNLIDQSNITNTIQFNPPVWFPSGTTFTARFNLLSIATDKTAFIRVLAYKAAAG